MPPRPLHRWKSFWLGIIVILFLAWSWSRSIELAEKIVIGDPDTAGFIEFGQSSGLWFLSVSSRRDETALKGYSESLRTGPDIALWENPIEQPDLRLPPSISDVIETGWGIGIAHWFLLIIFLPLWLIFLIRRQQSIQRLQRSISQASTGS